MDAAGGVGAAVTQRRGLLASLVTELLRCTVAERRSGGRGGDERGAGAAGAQRRRRRHCPLTRLCSPLVDDATNTFCRLRSRSSASSPLHSSSLSLPQILPSLLCAAAMRLQHDHAGGSSLVSSLTRGQRPYQVALVALLVCFVGYASWVAQRESACRIDALTPRPAAAQPGPGAIGGPMAVVAPPPVCNCHCDCGRSGGGDNDESSKTSSSSSSSKTVVGRIEDGSEDLAKALVATGWRPQLSSQSYSGVPVAGAEDDPLSHMPFVRAVYPPVGPELGSTFDAKFLATPVAYGTAFVPAAAPAAPASEQAFIPRPACQKDSDVLQKYIYANQHPENCKTRQLFVRRHMPSYGLFAGLGLSSNYLFLASTLGRTLIDLSPNTYFTGNCPSNGLDCAFLPISNCTAADFSESEVCYNSGCFDSARVISIDHLSLNDYLPCSPTEFPVQRCSKDGPRPTKSLHQILPELSLAHGEQFFQGEFSRYLTRPNKRLSEFAAQQMKQLKLTDQLIGVHIRHGDKIGEGIQFPTQAYGLVIRRAVQVTGIKVTINKSKTQTSTTTTTQHKNRARNNPACTSVMSAQTEAKSSLSVRFAAVVFPFVR